MKKNTTEENPLRRISPSAKRNFPHILPIVEEHFENAGRVLEIASGTGYHAYHFAEALDPIQWLPSDPSPEALASIQAWVNHYPSDNLLEPIALDVHQPKWPIADGIVAINMIHISPWSATLALFRGAQETLASGSKLFLYGPFKVSGEFTSESNQGFDLNLKKMNPEYGVRDLEKIQEVAAEAEFNFVERVNMPANNFSLVFSRR